jgi:radical SAM superfamily enzyme YgiQ (UPF0313 family)
MRVLLTQPPLSASQEVTPPLGLCTLAAWLRLKGHDVRIFDLDLEVKRLQDGQGRYLSLLEQAVRDFAPAAVGVTSMYNNSLQAERMTRVIKNCDPAIATIAGGSHFGALGQQALRRIPELDYAIEGEGEQTFSTLLSALESNSPVEDIPRLHYRVNGELRANSSAGLMELADLPAIWPNLEGIINLGQYAETVPPGSPRRSIYIEAGRGCPFACTFCATAPFWERRYRVKPVDRIIGEMRFLFEEYGYNGFMLVHDLLTADTKFINAFSEALIESRLPVEWMANHRTDINLRGLLPKMKAAGCWAMFFGVESASTRLQKEMHKGLKREGVFSTITELSGLGIASTCSFVIGFPTETKAELSATIGMGAELKLIGAGLIQYHRLRTWPPAPLANAALPAEFDFDSLRIEYPFLEVPSTDVNSIKEDPEFFGGYFAPFSQAGTFGQLADVELFFTQAVSAAPLTVAVLGRVMGGTLIETFYELVERRGSITREEIEADPSSLLPIWFRLRELLQEWVKSHPSLEDWQRQLVLGVMAYEEQRLLFVNSDTMTEEGLAAFGPNWRAFYSDVQIDAVFEALYRDQPLGPELMNKGAVVMVRHEPNSYRAYSTDLAHLSDLPNHPLLAATVVSH